MTDDQSGAGTFDFESVFGEDKESDLSLDRLEVSWEEARPVEAERKGVDPNQLIRFVYDGKVHWITHEEAITFLQIADDQNKRQNAIKREIKRALRGEKQALADELSVMLAVSTSTVGRYKEEGSISASDIQMDLKPALQRRSQEVETLIDCLEETEQTIAQKRKQAPIFDEYEKMLGEMMNLSRGGKKAEAAELARKLHVKKREYVITSRAIEPDVYTSYYYRLELQKTKRRILTLQRQLSQQRAKALEKETGELEEELTQRKAEREAQDALVARGVTLSEEETEQYARNVEEIDKIQEKIVGKEMERESLEKETEVLQTQIENADKVITYITEEVLTKSGVEDAVDERVRMMNAKRGMRKQPGLGQLGLGKSSSRMVTVDRHHRK